MIIETNRLILREFEITDAEAMFNLNLDPDVIRYTGDPPFASVESTREFLLNYADYRKNGYGRWAVDLKKDSSFIGWCGLKLHEEGFTDIGFRIFKNQWNKGYMTEAAKATLGYGFKHLGLNEIIGRAALENKASIRVLEKIGMQYWKQGECHGIDNVAYYRISREDI